MRYDAIVVGAGISGLLATLALSKEGKNVLLLEKEGEVGGICRSYEIKGYKVDTGPHIITGLEDGPIQVLMDKYFDVMPKFIENGQYFVRFDNKAYVFPWTIPDWISFPPFSVEDRLNIVRAMFDLVADYTSRKNLTAKTVSNYTVNYKFSKRALGFIDCICVFLTGVGMKETPVSRILDAGRSKNKPKTEKIKKLLLGGGKTQHYPRGGVQNIVNALVHSMPENAEIHTCEEVLEIVIDNEQVAGIVTNKSRYTAKVVIYAGANKHLHRLVELPEEYGQKLRNLKQVRTLTLWLGLNKKYFAEAGSEIWTESRKPCWAIPTSNFDPALAPKGKQLVGFAFILADEEEVTGVDDYINVIEGVFPDIKKHIEMAHYQVLVPEAAANAKNNFFSGVKLPINGLYAVGTDITRQSMGVTRAAYSVVSLLENLDGGRM